MLVPTVLNVLSSSYIPSFDQLRCERPEKNLSVRQGAPDPGTSAHLRSGFHHVRGK